MADYNVIEMTKDEYLARICEWYNLEEGELLMDEDGFMLSNGQYADDPSIWPDPLPVWFGELPWGFDQEEIDNGAIEPDSEGGYARLIDSNPNKLWEIPWVD